MNVRLFSDLHVEFGEISLSAGDADVAVFAGDVDIGMRGIDWIIRQHFPCPVIYVLGNHEYYRHTYPGLIEAIRGRAARANIHVLENASVTLGGVAFHGATLWTDFAIMGDARLSAFACERVVNDFSLIQNDKTGKPFRAVDAARIHRASLAWLAKSLQASLAAVNVVVTHHAPSVRSVASRYRENIVTTSFASDLEAFILEHAPDYWLHGHLHASSDYVIGRCHVRCNPRGYRKALNTEFDPTLTLKINA